jgi:hypothetical protein
VEALNVVIEESKHQDIKCGLDKVLFSVQVRGGDARNAIKNGFDELLADYGTPSRKSVH